MSKKTFTPQPKSKARPTQLKSKARPTQSNFGSGFTLIEVLILIFLSPAICFGEQDYDHTYKMTGEIEADSRDAAVAKLTADELIPISVAEKQGTGDRVQGTAKDNKPVAKPISFGGEFAKIKTKDIDTFTRQLSSLIRANVPVLRALSLIVNQTENKSLKNLVSGFHKQIKDGKMLSEVLSKYPQYFNKLYLSMVKAGEKAGVLDEMLLKLTEHREREDEVRKKIQAALAYPALMIVVGIGTVFVMLTFFLPKIAGMFDSVTQTLPLPTKILVGISSLTSNYWHIILIIVAASLAVFMRVKPGSKKKLLLDMVKLSIPFVRKFITSGEVSKFTRTLGMLLKNGIPVYEGLNLAIATIDNDALRERLEQTSKDIVNQGARLSQSLEKIDVFPKFVVNMIAVGEEGGKLDESLAEITRVYEKEIDQSIKVMTSLIEPVLILIVGSIVGFIVFAMLLPIFNIGMGK
ncbi:type II secretion system F family protein [Candidatus Omnitrophota bacterium]